MGGFPAWLFVWVDVSTNLLIKGEIILDGFHEEGETFHFFYRQVFAGYDSDISIEPPILDVPPSSMRLKEGDRFKIYEVPSVTQIFGGKSESENK